MAVYGYVISKQDLKILDVFTVSDYDLNLDLEYDGKSSIILDRVPQIDEGDFVFLKNDAGKIFYIGVTDTISNDSGSAETTINLLEKESIFDRKVILSGESVISTTGIEDFIVNTIKSNFVTSDDSFLNLRYITIKALTHTKVYASVDTENGIFNVKTYLGNAREYYGIFLDFKFTGSALEISVYRKDQATFKIDAGVTDVTNYIEDYNVSALAKLTQIWKVPDQEENGVVTKVGAKTIRKYYLLNDRSISTNVSDPNRAKGEIDVIYTECENEAEATQTVINSFMSNKYDHSVSADIRRESEIYPEDEFYIGHKCEIKTKAHGVRDSIISQLSYSKGSAYLSVKFGKMPVTLIEKLRKERKEK